MPGRPGRWDLREIAKWKALRIRDPANQNGAAHETRKMQRARLKAEIRCKKADAVAKERDNHLAEGEYVLRADVNREVAAIFANIRHQLMRLPAILQPFFPVDQQIELAQETRNQINNILRILAAWRPGKGGLESK
jgi:phage terminase Nu1 subunit (DNA packaging protein)